MNWSRLKKNEKQLILVCFVPIILILLIAMIVMIIAGSAVGVLVQSILYPVWMIGVFIYIVIDSKSRWPQASAFQRFANVITFKR